MHFADRYLVLQSDLGAYNERLDALTARSRDNLVQACSLLLPLVVSGGVKEPKSATTTALLAHVKAAVQTPYNKMLKGGWLWHPPLVWSSVAEEVNDAYAQLKAFWDAYTEVLVSTRVSSTCGAHAHIRNSMYSACAADGSVAC
jgi:hypothetical protein